MEKQHIDFKHSIERLPALVLAGAATFLVFAGINAGFTRHAADLSGRLLDHTSLIL